MAVEVRTEREIEADPADVWAVLTDLPRYSEWNPFLVEARGAVDLGARLRITMANGGSRTTFRPVITRLEHGRVLEWLGRAGIPGIFDGRHRFELTKHAGGALLVQSERFSGVSVPLLRNLRTGVAANFTNFNEALRERVLELHGASSGGSRGAGQESP